MRKAADINTPVLGSKRQHRRVAVEADDEAGAPIEHHGRHRNARAMRFADGPLPQSNSPRVAVSSPTSPASPRQQEQEDADYRDLASYADPPEPQSPKASPDLLDLRTSGVSPQPISRSKTDGTHSGTQQGADSRHTRCRSMPGHFITSAPPDHDDYRAGRRATDQVRLD